MVAYGGYRWRVAQCIPPLYDAAQKLAPNRSHASDGTIGDLAHRYEGRPTWDYATGRSNGGSDHNPDMYGTVCALDLTHDPAHGFDAWHVANVIANNILAGKENRVSYLVCNDHSGSSDQIFHNPYNQGWRWSHQSGSDHISHLHTSVNHFYSINSQMQPWDLTGIPGVQPKPVYTEDQDMFFAKKSNDATVYLVVGAGRIPMNSPAELEANQKAVSAAGFNANVVIFPISNGIDAGTFLDNIPKI
jgi:hypothetical protein